MSSNPGSNVNLVDPVVASTPRQMPGRGMDDAPKGGIVNDDFEVIVRTPVPTKVAAQTVDCGTVVAQILSGDEAGSKTLYGVLSRGLRYYVSRQLGSQDCEDKVHEIYVIVVRAIRNGELREPERLMGFVHTVARRQVASYIKDRVQGRQKETDLESGAQIVERSNSPEAQAILRQRHEIAKKALRGLPERDRQILIRFYLHEEPQEQICREMTLTDTQFRLRKSRAKARFAMLGKLQMRRPVIPIPDGWPSDPMINGAAA